MVTCTPWCGIGVRHIQFFLLAVMNCMDFWIQELDMSIFVHKNSEEAMMREHGGDRSFRPQGRVVLTSRQKNIIYMITFFAYTAGRISSAFIVFRVSNKYLLLGMMLLENITGACLVWFVHIVGVIGIVLFFVTTSFCRAMHTPLMYNIMAKWLPPHEITTAWCIITVVKETFSVSLSHFVAKMNYVESVVAFMLVSFANFGWIAIYLVFGAESPQTSFLVSKLEWNFLSRTIGPRKKIHCKAQVPWKSIFMCCILYSYIILDFGKESNGSAIVAAVQAVGGKCDFSGPQIICMQTALMLYSAALLTSSIFVDNAIKNEKFEPGPIRKVMSTVASCGIAISMILAAYVDHYTVKIAYLFIAHCSYMIIHTAEPAILFDLSPNYSAVIYAGISLVRNLMVAGRLLIDPKLKQFDLTLKGPNVTTHLGPSSPDGLLYRYGFLMFFTNLFFIISGNIELKDFDSYDTYDWRKQSVISYP